MRPGHWLAFAAAVLLIIGVAGYGLWRIKQRSPAPVTSAKAPASAEPTAPVPSEAELKRNIQRAGAVHATNLRPMPILFAARDGIYLEGRRIGPWPLRPSTQPDNIADVAEALRAHTSAWSSKYAVHGELALWIDRSTSVVLAKSLLQTSADAASFSAYFVVKSPDYDGDPVGLEVRPDGSSVDAAPTTSWVLGVNLRVDGQVELAWSADEKTSPPSTVKMDQLTTVANQLWREWFAHRGPEDPAWVAAYVSVPDDAAFATLIEVIDGLTFAEKYKQGNLTQAFRFTLGVKPPAQSPRAMADQYRASRPSLKLPSGKLSGRLDPKLIQGVIRNHFDSFRKCYQALLVRDPFAAGRISARFVIERDGTVSSAELDPGSTSTLTDPQLQTCVLDAYRKLKFPKPEGGIVTVVYPLQLQPE